MSIFKQSVSKNKNKKIPTDLLLILKCLTFYLKKTINKKNNYPNRVTRLSNIFYLFVSCCFWLYDKNVVESY